MIEVIGDNPGITTTRIAEKLAITKGAVSQTTSRLQEKGIIQKQPSPEKGNSTVIALTALGQAVFLEHRALHRQMTDEIEVILHRMAPETRQELKEILRVIDHALDTY